jgi:hypothetical protein
MIEPRTNLRLYALRVCPDALAPAWWEAAHAHSADAPAPVRALLGGRTRVELSAEEAVRAIHWAAQLTGWDQDERRPVFVYPSLDADRP